MNEQIMRELGFGRQVDLRSQCKCPFCCMDVVLEEFRDDLSLREYKISGLCQSCQDSMFDNDGD